MLGAALTTRRLRLDPLRTTDAAEMVGVLADPSLYAVTGGEPPTLEQLAERYAAQVAGDPTGRSRWLNWIVRHDGIAVGYVQATVHAEYADVAWVIGVPWQGQGLASEAAAGMLAQLVDGGVLSIRAHIRPGHHASEAVAARLGLHATPRLDADGERLWSSVVDDNPACAREQV